MALDVQDACNLSGVVNSFATEVMPALWEESRKRNEGTAWINHHPIVTLFIDKLASLNYSGGYEQHYGMVMDAYCKVHEIAENTQKEVSA